MIFNPEKYSIILPGRIVTYSAETQMATVRICVERSYNTSDETGQVERRLPIEYVPVFTPGGGGWHMTFPIKAGDSCILFFSQQGYDHWLWEDKDTAGTLAGNVKPHVRRQFHEDDGFAFVGINTLPRKVDSYSASNSQWRNADATQVISLNEDDSITITSPVAITINCTTANVNASSKVSVTSPLSEFSGNVTVGGTLAVAGAIGGGGASPSSGIAVSGGISATSDITTDGDVIASGVSLTGHGHPALNTPPS